VATIAEIMHRNRIYNVCYPSLQKETRKFFSESFCMKVGTDN